MFKKLFAVCLMTVTLLSFASCGEEKKPQPTTNEKDTVQTGTPVTSDDTDVDNDEGAIGDIDYEDGLSTERYDGYEYRMLVRKGKTNSQYFEESQEDVIDDAIYRRNQEVAERYGITISASESSSGDYEVDALNSILAGDDAYDIIFAHSRAAFVYAIQGAACNVLDIDSIHTDKPWWSKNITDNCSLNNHLYVLDGDISINGLSGAMCLLFNKRIFDEKGFDYPYELVKDGEWTFDELAYLVKKGSADLNGDGVLKPEDDQYGLTTFDWGYPIGVIYTGGQKIYGRDDEGNFALTLYTNKTVEIFDEFFRLMDNEAVYMSNGSTTLWFSNLFKEGRAMFSDGSLGEAKSLRDMDDDFGILPYPKFDSDDEYATVINGYNPLIVIPITVSDTERTGAITEALCAYGSKYVLPAFYDVSLKTKYSRDDESEEMMDTIRDSIIYDVGYVAGGTFQSTGHDLANSTTHDFASFYAGREGSAKVGVKEFNESYGGIEQD